MDGGEVVEKRKKGRPRKDKMTTPISSLPFTPQVEPQRQKRKTSVEESVKAVSDLPPVGRLPLQWREKPADLLLPRPQW